ncbi:hypothetical protein [Sinorhizobium meliloti]|uniref:Uncharacterized protein n=1 Tax=Rhizobium meliloti TaxID=382 RepID=A0AAW9TNT8_RHIML|nr:hypothetical protein [Sinorhizobium meliloti]MQW33564.1 hypothetical protein [Sinorhizobium meliloti]MQW46104.1 hypothetical protein [Sinorhizobium meliloti]
MIDIKERHELEVAVSRLNKVIGHLYDRYAGQIRIRPWANFSGDTHASVAVEVTQVIARVGE